MVNYGKEGVEQALTQEELQKEVIKYTIFRIAQYNKKKPKQEITLKYLREKQSLINRKRRLCGLKPINIVDKARKAINEQIAKIEANK